MSKLCRMRDWSAEFRMLMTYTNDKNSPNKTFGKTFGTRHLTKFGFCLVSAAIMASMIGNFNANAQSANAQSVRGTEAQSYGGSNEIERRTISIQSGESIANALRRAGADAGDAKSSVTALGRVIDTSDIKRDDQLTIFVRQDGNTKRLLGFNLASGSDRSITVTRNIDGDYRARELQTKMQKRSLRVAGVIGNNGLMASVREQGAPDRVADALADAFAYDVDFEREVGPGSSFELMFDRVSDSRGAVVREGEPTYARLTTLNGKSIELYRYQPNGNNFSEWYDENGRSARKFLMKTPINGARLTSGFGSRVHPISGFTKMHEGIDFGAPTGTPIYAAGDGVVTRAGVMGGYGNVVDIEHGGGWSTRYAHLSKFAAGLSVGDRVKQGQVVALSGNTGRSTGPHLHFEVRKNGGAVNPLSAQVPSGQTLSGNDYRSFQNEVARIDKLRRESLSGSNIVTNGITVRASN